jgi:hypothetical protein
LLCLAGSLYGRGKPGAACAVSGFAIFFGWPCFLLPALMVTAAVMLVFGLFCMSRQAALSTFLKGSLAAFAASHFIFGVNAFLSTKRNAELAAEYPLESMADRLAYETRRKPSAPGAGQAAAVSPTLQQAGPELSRLEEKIQERMGGATLTRDFYLRFMHDDVVAGFINSPGFGISRRVEPRSEYIELPPPPTIAFPAPPEYTPWEDSGTAKLSDSASAGDPASREPPAEQSLRRLHEDGFLDFVNPGGFGVVLDRQRARGFQVHHFRKMPTLAEPSSAKERWRVQRLELMSLLRHEEPAVYLSAHLPRMDELRDSPTRPLDAFETRALSALKSGGDLRFECSADQIQMLGSIRAIEQCTRCHAAERGELLGAFSYTLRRVSRP